MSLPWMKLFHEARGDKKVAQLTDPQFRVWVNGMLFASEQTANRGTIPPMDEEELALEIADGDVTRLRDALAVCARWRFIVPQEDGSLLVRAFARRNARKASDEPEAAAARKKKSRDGKAGAGVTNDASRGVTRGHALEEEGEGEEDQDVEQNQNRQEEGDRAGARGSSSPSAAGRSSTGEPALPAAEAGPVVEVDGWAFDAELVDQLDAAAEGLGLNGVEVPGILGLRLYKASTAQPPTVKPAMVATWNAMSAADVTAWTVEALAIGRSTPERRHDAARALDVAKGAIARDLELGRSLPAEAAAKRARNGMTAITGGQAAPAKKDDAAIARENAEAIKVQLADPDEARRADLARCAALVSLYGFSSEKVANALAKQGITLDELLAHINNTAPAKAGAC